MAPRVLVVGAGPIGIEAAVLLVKSGMHVLLVERGAELAANVRQWRHVQLFSSNELNCSEWGLQACSELGVELPKKDEQPTGAHFCQSYLDQLGAWLHKQPNFELRLGTIVDAISRGSVLKNEEVKAAGETMRDEAPFSALLSANGTEESVTGLSAVLDCTGTYGNPNFVGRGGMPALGERALRAAHCAALPGTFDTPASRYIYLGLPDVLGTERGAFVSKAGGKCSFRRVVLVGSGYSAATVLLQLRQLATENLEAPLEVTLIDGDFD